MLGQIRSVQVIIRSGLVRSDQDSTGQSQVKAKSDQVNVRSMSGHFKSGYAKSRQELRQVRSGSGQAMLV